MSPLQVRAETETPTSSEEFQRAVKTAAEFADRVDRDAQFPTEAVTALRAAGALSWYVPRKYGGAEMQFADLCEATLELARRCAATGMIFAMHQIQVASIVRHAATSPWFEDYLRRLASEQRLIASATSEVGIGGDVRRSSAALHPGSEADGDLLHFEKNCPTISYGAQADDLLTTLRRTPDADQGDQILVLTDARAAEMKQLSEWDTLGMRGTCSPAFRVRATCLPEQVLPAPFAAIAAETMVPFSHILWAHVWLGLSTDAFQRAQSFVREQARQHPGNTPPLALRLSELAVRVAEFRSVVQAALTECASLQDQGERSRLSSFSYIVRINNLKIAASEAAVDICHAALRVCGVAGYQNNGPYSVGRHLRDAHSAALMIANDRLHATNSALLMVCRESI
jgi:acyl-CoA dehydrogenase